MSKNWASIILEEDVHPSSSQSCCSEVLWFQQRTKWLIFTTLLVSGWNGPSKFIPVTVCCTKLIISFSFIMSHKSFTKHPHGVPLSWWWGVLVPIKRGLFNTTAHHDWYCELACNTADCYLLVFVDNLINFSDAVRCVRSMRTARVTASGKFDTLFLNFLCYSFTCWKNICVFFILQWKFAVSPSKG